MNIHGYKKKAKTLRMLSLCLETAANNEPRFSYKRERLCTDIIKINKKIKTLKTKIKQIKLERKKNARSQ